MNFFERISLMTDDESKCVDEVFLEFRDSSEASLMFLAGQLL